jgi:heme oxygenase
MPAPMSGELHIGSMAFTRQGWRMIGDGRFGAPGARVRLRDATADVHEALHHLPAFEALLSGRLELEEYRTMLRGLYAYHGAAQAICTAADAALGLEGPGENSRSRLARLAEDLESLGIVAAPTAARPAQADPAWNIGYAYVVAGSAIGGQVLHRALARLFPKGEAGRSFFALAPAERIGWRRFCALMDAELDDDADPRAERGAHAAFSAFRADMERVGST